MKQRRPSVDMERAFEMRKGGREGVRRRSQGNSNEKFRLKSSKVKKKKRGTARSSNMSNTQCYLCLVLYAFGAILVFMGYRAIVNLQKSLPHEWVDKVDQPNYYLNLSSVSTESSLKILERRRDKSSDKFSLPPKVPRGFRIFSAGHPTFQGNFARDSIITCLLLQDEGCMRSQLLFSAWNQGTNMDPGTGEELGKISHEIPGKNIRKLQLSTKFSACDTTSLFLIGAHWLAVRLKKSYTREFDKVELFKELKPAVVAAIKYIETHVDTRGRFFEDAGMAGALRYALATTYWKDSPLSNSDPKADPEYPVVYPLAHAMALAAVRAAARLLDGKGGHVLSVTHRVKLHQLADRMRKALRIMMLEGFQNRRREESSLSEEFPVAIFPTSNRTVSTYSSDGLHMLAYLESGDLSENVIFKLQNSSRILETPIGYLSGLSLTKGGSQRRNSYHEGNVWPFEQALIYLGASRFGLDHVASVAMRILAPMAKMAKRGNFPEYFARKSQVTGMTSWVSAGSKVQLWTIGAYQNLSRTVEINIQSSP
mmetsp:Transcript_9720/g.14562  ORF Transcript_9720/g.14562 Transcript_9720/m.14562 type:complete len:539 (-) Transcript_9720:120-1736(-)